jgi:hypothetical protein
MNRVNFIALGVVGVVAFVASSLWYSPLFFGRQLVELSGVAGSPQPNAVKALCELLRTFVLAYVIARLIVRLNVAEWFRRYIHDLATRCDNGGDVQTIAILREDRDALQRRVEELEAKIALRKRPKRTV